MYPSHRFHLTGCTLLLGLSIANSSFASDSPITEIEKVLCELGNLTTVAGGNGQGSGNPNEWSTLSEGGSALTAELSEPHMAMDDIWGNIYVADKNGHAIRKILPDGRIFTVAGKHRYMSPNVGGFDGDGVATDKLLCFPNGIFVFPDGSFYMLETGDVATLGRVRKVSRNGQMTTVFTELGNVMQRGLWVSPDESLIYYCTNTQLRRFLPGQAVGPDNPRTLMNLGTSASLANIDVDKNGSILIADRGRNRVYLLPPTAQNVTSPLVVAGSGVGGNSLGNNADDDGAIATSVTLNEARGVAFHPLGGFFVACHKGGDIWYVDTQSPPHIHFLIRGDDRDSNSNPLRIGDNQPLSVDRNVSKLAEPRSVRFGWHGDLIICCNDSGFVRVVKSVLPPSPAPTLCFTALGEVKWPGKVSGTYFLQTSQELTEGSWQTDAWKFPAADGDVVHSILPTLSARKFFRVGVCRRWPF